MGKHSVLTKNKVFQQNKQATINEHLKHILYNFSDIVWVWDLSSKTIAFSYKWCEVTGYKISESILSSEVLKSAGNRINECVREKDMISHIPFQKIITYLKYESFFNP